MQAIIKPENPRDLPTQKLPLGCPVLDRFLRGGIPIGSVTELVGESGSGKTQLVLQLLLAALQPPSPSASLYIHSEFPFPLRRLKILSYSHPRPHPLPHPNPLDYIFVRGAHSPSDLLSILTTLTPPFLVCRPPPSLPIRLIIIDSIAALFRSEFDNNPADLKRRSSLFFRIAGKLKELARRFELAVVVTNQVVDVVGSDEGLGGVRVGNFGELWTSGRRVWPALGLSWGNCVNSRIFLSRREEIGGREEEEASLGVGDLGEGRTRMRTRTRRMMQVVFAPHLPESSAEFAIVKGGVFGVMTVIKPN